MSGKQWLADIQAAAHLARGHRVLFCASANTPQEAWTAARNAKARMQALGAPTENMGYWPSPVVQEDSPEIRQSPLILIDELSNWPET